MKRSRRVILTMIGSSTIGAVSAGFIERHDCGGGFDRDMVRGLDGRPYVTCQGVVYGGFGRGPFHGHGHHGGG